ncbi:MAG: type IX secretion system membrane protein PorP/SprF [Bacteroidota bacterium]
MKKILLISSFAFLFVNISKAQQDAQYSQFMFNKLAYNSGFTGTEDKICVTGLFRSQWMGFGTSSLGESPQTFVGTIHSPMGQHFGVGMSILNDKIGFTNNLNAILSLSYRYTFSNSSMLSVGLGGGFYQQSVAGSKFKFIDPGDPKIPTSDVTGLTPDFSFGLYYTKPSIWKFDDFYAGLSATHLTQGKVAYNVPSGTVETQLRLHYYFMTGASYALSSSLALEPNILIKYDMAKITTDINVMAMYNNKIRGGLTYRTIDAIAILAGYKFTPNLQVGMSYDITTSKIRDFSNGSVEVMLKYCFMPKIKPPVERPPIPRLTPRFL